MKKKRRIRWLVITIPTSHIIFFSIAFLLVISGILFVIYGGRFMDGRHLEKAKSSIAEAKKLLEDAVAVKIPRSDLTAVQTLIGKAETALEAGDARSARRDGETSVEQLSYMLATFRSESEGITGRFARIIEMKGTVEKLSGDGTNWEAVELKEVLRSGTRIRTQSGSTAKIKFDDGSVIHVKAESLIGIRELTEDEQTQTKRSNIELGISEIEANIKDPVEFDSTFALTMPDNSEARIKTESNLAIVVDQQNTSTVKVYAGNVDVVHNEQTLALGSREAVIIDSSKPKGKTLLTPISIPMPPRLVYPANGQMIHIDESSPAPLYMRWTTIQNAAEYKLEIARDYYFYEHVVNQTTKESRATVSTLTPGNYYWRISSYDPSGLSSEPSQFNTFRLATTQESQGGEKDLTPPKIQIDRLTVLGRIVDISGRTDPGSNLYINEHKEDVFEDGSFRGLIEFETPGLHSIYIEAYDNAGNATTARREVTISESASTR